MEKAPTVVVNALDLTEIAQHRGDRRKVVANRCACENRNVDREHSAATKGLGALTPEPFSYGRGSIVAKLVSRGQERDERGPLRFLRIEVLVYI